MDRQQEFVLRTLEERDIRFVRLWFTDVLGYLKSVAVAPAELEGAFAEGIGFDGSAPEPADHGGYFDQSSHDVAPHFRRNAIETLESMGISVEFSHHEGGPGQQEIDLRYADALSTADNIMTFRTVIREVALSQGIWASFMPKPFTTHPGSGMHTHVSLFEGDRNAFFEAGAEYQLSKTARQFIAGLLHHAPEITCITDQWVNSYKRLIGGGEAPSYICWGHNNRSAMVRVPMYK